MEKWIGLFYPGSGGSALAFGPPRLVKMKLPGRTFADATEHFYAHTRNTDDRIAVCDATYADAVERAIQAQLKKRGR